MTNTITGGHDLAIEISQDAFSAIVAQRLVGDHVVPGGAVRVGSAQATVLPAGPATVELSVRIDEGTIAVGPGALRDLAFDAVIPAKLSVVPTAGPLKLLVEPSAMPKVTWRPGVAASLAQQATALGLAPAIVDFVQGAIAIGLNDAREIELPGLEFDPAQDGLSLTALRSCKAEITTQPAASGHPAMVTLLLTTMTRHASGATKSLRTSAALVTGQQIAVTISPEAVRDGLLCPAIATQVGAAATSLCPVCGDGTARSVLHVLPAEAREHISAANLDAITLAFHQGHASCSVSVSGKAKGFGLAAGLTAELRVSVVGGAVKPAVNVTSTAADLDIPTGVHFATLGALVPIELAIEAIGRGLIGSFATGAIDSGLTKLGALAPPAIAGMTPSVTSAEIHPQGLTVQGTIELAKPIAKPTIKLSETLAVEELYLGSGVTSNVTCFADRSYPYSDYAAMHTWTVTVSTTGFPTAPLPAISWFLNDTKVLSGSRSVSLAVDGEDPRTGDLVAQAIVSTVLAADQRTLTVRSTVPLLDFGVHLRCDVDDGIGVYNATLMRQFTCLQRQFGPEYFADQVACIAKENPKARYLHLRWPASDPAGWEYPGRLDEIRAQLEKILGQSPRPPIDNPWSAGLDLAGAPVLRFGTHGVYHCRVSRVALQIARDSGEHEELGRLRDLVRPARAIRSLLRPR